MSTMPASRSKLIFETEPLYGEVRVHALGDGRAYAISQETEPHWQSPLTGHLQALPKIVVRDLETDEVVAEVGLNYEHRRLRAAIDSVTTDLIYHVVDTAALWFGKQIDTNRLTDRIEYTSHFAPLDERMERVPVTVSQMIHAYGGQIYEEGGLPRSRVNLPAASLEERDAEWSLRSSYYEGLAAAIALEAGVPKRACAKAAHRFVTTLGARFIETGEDLFAPTSDDVALTVIIKDTLLRKRGWGTRTGF